MAVCADPKLASRPADLLSLCAAKIIRDNISIDPIEGCQIHKQLQTEKKTFRASAENRTCSRLSGSMWQILASLESSNAVFEDVNCIKWFAAGNYLSEVIQAWKVFKDHDPIDKCRLFLLGALTGENYECLRYACLALSKCAGRSSCRRMVEWMYESDECLPRFNTVSMGLVSDSFRCGKSVKSIMHGNRLLKQDLPRVYAELDYHYVPTCGTTAFTYKVINLGAWSVVPWMLYTRVSISTTYLICCLKLNRFDMLKSELNLSSLISFNIAKWVWKECSLLALQWILCNASNVQYVLSNIQICFASVAKLDILADYGVMLPELFVERAAQCCSVEIFAKFVECCRSWSPERCFQASLRNTEQRSKEIRRYINRSMPDLSNRPRVGYFRVRKRCSAGSRKKHVT